MKVRNNKFHHFLCFLLFFITSTHCYLIPNERVITDDPEDFGLLEGITYNIVHYKSGMYLSVHDDVLSVSVPDDSNLYQHWSLRKVEGNQYNIVNVGTGMNLD